MSQHQVEHASGDLRSAVQDSVPSPDQVSVVVMCSLRLASHPPQQPFIAIATPIGRLEQLKVDRASVTESALKAAIRDSHRRSQLGRLG
jgi:hypothetical protein